MIKWDVECLTDKQFYIAMRAMAYPYILPDRGSRITGASLERHGYGNVEDGAGGGRIFRLNEDGLFAMNEHRASCAFGDDE